MKSMLHEASSVTKAITKAWEESGQPIEFTIKVLEKGQNGLLWFSKHPAIVSITYDPKKQTIPGIVEKKEPLQQKFQKPYQQQPKKTFSSHSNDTDRKHTPFPDKKSSSFFEKKTEPKEQKQRPQQEQDFSFDKTPSAWIDEWADNISSNLKDIVAIIGISTPFTTKIDRRTLHITFANTLLSSAEEERMLFISLSYLLIQFLKKRFKKKMRGFHLVLKSKHHEKEPTS
ncbi:MAG: Jag N-terminal domain-containing protein [bacterium]